MGLSDLLILVGPIFSIGRIIGDDRARQAELFLLKAFAASTKKFFAITSLGIHLLSLLWGKGDRSFSHVRVIGYSSR
jgi:hypothetical protein